MDFLGLKARVENVVGPMNEIGQFINNGQLELAKVSKKRKKQDLVFVGGVATLPASCLILAGIAWDGTPLTLYPSTDIIFPSLEGNTTPSRYQVWDQDVYLDTKADGTATLIYVPKPATMVNDSDLPEIDAPEAIIAYAIWHAYRILEHPDKSQFWHNEWLQEQASWMQTDRLKYKAVHRVRVIGGI